MLLIASRSLLKHTTPLIPQLTYFSNSSFSTLQTPKGRKLNTQVFSDLTYTQLATPQYTKALIIKPIHNHSGVSQRSLFHRKRVSGKIVTCFSQRKHKVFRRVHKLRRQLYSQILKQKINVVLSSKAFRTINKMGSFDTYILCTKPKDLDSKYGEYLRQLMLRKINDPDFRMPYIIGTNRKMRIKNYRKQMYIQSLKKIIIPKQIKQNLRTFQRKFGKTVEQLNNEDYAKYVQLQNLKRTLGQQLEPTHPLLLELKQKMKDSIMTQDQQRRFDNMAKQMQQKFVNDPKHGQANRKRVEKAKNDIELLNIKLNQMRFKLQKQQLQQLQNQK